MPQAKPKPVFMTRTEGGPWLPFDRDVGRESLVHSILFEDGSVFDAVNGWREGTIYCPKCHHRIGDYGSHR